MSVSWTPSLSFTPNGCQCVVQDLGRGLGGGRWGPSTVHGRTSNPCRVPSHPVSFGPTPGFTTPGVPPPRVSGLPFPNSTWWLSFAACHGISLRSSGPRA